MMRKESLTSPSMLPLKPSSPMAIQKRTRRVVAGDRKSEAGSRTTTLVASADSRTIYYQQGGYIQTIRCKGGDPDKRKLAVPADAKFLVSPKDSKQILVWSLSSTSSQGLPRGAAVLSKKFVKLVDFETGHTIMSLNDDACVCGKDLCVDRDWKRVVVLGDTSVEVYRLDNGELVAASPRSPDSKAPIFSCIAAFHDNAHAAIAHADRNLIMVWSLTQARTVKTLEGNPPQELIGHIEVSKDNRTLLGLSNTSIFVWDVELRSQMRKIDLPSKDPTYSLFSPLKVAVSSDWKWVIVRADYGNTIKFVELEKGEIMASFSDSNTTMNAACLTPDFRSLVTMDHVQPDTLVTGKVYMTFWDMRKILRDLWYSYRGSYNGSTTKDGKRNGHGKCYLLDKSIYDGEWSNDDRHGYGRQDYVDGAIYEGQWSEDVRSGHGTCRYPDHSRYEGEWSQDGREGQGTCWYADGSRYQGAWKDDRRHGEGESRSPFGARYKGDFVQDQKEGHGICEYTDGSRYDGLWSHDDWNGRGVLYGADKTRYEGAFKKGKRHGIGKLFNAQGVFEYEGLWKDNLRHGMGKEFSANGSVRYEGLWKEGVKANKGADGPLAALLGSPRSASQLPSQPAVGKKAKTKGARGAFAVILAVGVVGVSAAVAYYAKQYQEQEGGFVAEGFTGTNATQLLQDLMAAMPWQQAWR